MSIPYTYLITHIPTNMKYYGVRYSKNCRPEELGVKYFSSSKYIKKLILEEGICNFSFQVRKTFNDSESAKKWEHKFISKVKAVQSSMWFNQANGKPNGKAGRKHLETTKIKMRGPRPKSKKPKSEEHRQKLHDHLDKVRTVPVWSEERKKEHSKNMTGEGNWNYGKSDHPGAIKIIEASKSRKGKSDVEVYGAERAAEIAKKRRENMPKKRNIKKRTCPHCNKTSGGGYMTVYHFDNCKKKPSH